MQSSCDAALACLLAHEGGYSNHPDDPGDRCHMPEIRGGKESLAEAGSLYAAVFGLTTNSISKESRTLTVVLSSGLPSTLKDL